MRYQRLREVQITTDWGESVDNRVARMAMRALLHIARLDHISKYIESLIAEERSYK